MTGFALTGGRTDTPTFAWDWFNVDRPGHATKLQETGELAFRMIDTGEAWDIVETGVLTDASIRIVEMRGQAAQEPRWRITIKKGSKLQWPCLQDEQIALLRVE